MAEETTSTEDLEQDPETDVENLIKEILENIEKLSSTADVYCKDFEKYSQTSTIDASLLKSRMKLAVRQVFNDDI